MSGLCADDDTERFPRASTQKMSQNTEIPSNYKCLYETNIKNSLSSENSMKIALISSSRIQKIQWHYNVTPLSVTA